MIILIQSRLLNIYEYSLNYSSVASSAGASRAFMLRLIFLSSLLKSITLASISCPIDSTSAGLATCLSGNLGYVKKCIYTRCKLHECAKVCHMCNFTFNSCFYSEVLSCCEPWICFLEFKGKCDSLSVDLFDKNFDFIANSEYFPGSLLALRYLWKCEEVRQSIRLTGMH